jgi:hypothetical protein
MKRNLVDIPLNGGKASNGTESFQEKQHFLVGFFSGFRLQYQFTDNILTVLETLVFSILI